MLLNPTRELIRRVCVFTVDADAYYWYLCNDTRPNTHIASEVADDAARQAVGDAAWRLGYRLVFGGVRKPGRQRGSTQKAVRDRVIDLDVDLAQLSDKKTRRGLRTAFFSTNLYLDVRCRTLVKNTLDLWKRRKALKWLE